MPESILVGIFCGISCYVGMVAERFLTNRRACSDATAPINLPGKPRKPKEPIRPAPLPPPRMSESTMTVYDRPKL